MPDHHRLPQAEGADEGNYIGGMICRRVAVLRSIRKPVSARVGSDKVLVIRERLNDRQPAQAIVGESVQQQDAGPVSASAVAVELESVGADEIGCEHRL